MTALIVLICCLAYFIPAMLTWRHLGYNARHKSSSCLCFDKKRKWCEKRGIDYFRNRYDVPGVCFASAIFDYGWSFLVSLVFWLPYLIYVKIQQWFYSAEFNIGFFAPQATFESVEVRQERKQAELDAREANVRAMEIEAGIQPIDIPGDDQYTRPRWQTSLLSRR